MSSRSEASGLRTGSYDLPALDLNLAMPNPGPRVSFDLEVGKNVAPGSYIDFDETSLNGYLETIGCNKGDYPAHIRVATSLGNRAFGVYDTNSREITLKYDQQNRMNATLKHELQHWADDTNGKLEPTNFYALGQGAAMKMPIALIASTLSAGTTMANRIYEANTGAPLMTQEQLDAITIPASTFALGMCATSLLYYFNPAELRARRASRIKSAALFKLNTAAE